MRPKNRASTEAEFAFLSLPRIVNLCFAGSQAGLGANHSSPGDVSGIFVIF